MTPSVLAVAAATGRVAYTYFLDNELQDWDISDKAAGAPEDAASWVQDLIESYQPDVLVTERITSRMRKGEKTKEIIATIANLANVNYIPGVTVTPPRYFDNKYQEANHLAELFPELKPWLPSPRKFYEREPRDIILFEAVSLTRVVMDDPAAHIAASMG